MAYSEKVVDHYNNPRNVGSFGKDTPGVGTGLVGAPECGDVMKLQIKVNLETGVIEDAKFKTFGCGSAIASSSLATEWLKGKTVDEAAKIKNTDIVNELKLPPVKIHCSVLAEDAIKAALADYKEKHATDGRRGGIEIAGGGQDHGARRCRKQRRKQVKQLKEAQNLPETVFLRMGVKGGGLLGHVVRAGVRQREGAARQGVRDRRREGRRRQEELPLPERHHPRLRARRG